jgi:hypothetical protein
MWRISGEYLGKLAAIASPPLYMPQVICFQQMGMELPLARPRHLVTKGYLSGTIRRNHLATFRFIVAKECGHEMLQYAATSIEKAHGVSAASVMRFSFTLAADLTDIPGVH